jgi:hypothetical protein
MYSGSEKAPVSGVNNTSISTNKLIQVILGKNIFTPTPVNTASIKVKEIKVNCRGNRVAILADHVEGALQVRHRDSRLYVFDHNKGSIYTYDFKRDKRCPVSIFWDDIDERMLSVEV